MEDNKAPSNVIQFPTAKRKEAEGSVERPDSPSGVGGGAGGAGGAHKPAKKKRAPKKNVAGTVLAVILATGAVNRFVFDSKAASSSSNDLASVSTMSAGRTIASV